MAGREHKTPQFSVVITSYNKGPEILRAVASARSQGPGVEVIVVDDKSVDGSVDLLKSATLDQLIVHDTNQGALAAFLTGFRAARGDYLVMLDGDDQLMPGALQKLHAFKHLEAGTCIRLGMEPLSHTDQPLCAVENIETRFSFRPAHWMAITQNTGGAAMVLPRNLFTKLEQTTPSVWPDISVQDHIIPALFSFVANRFVRARTVAYVFTDAPAVPGLSTRNNRLRRDRLVSDHQIAQLATNGPLKRPLIARILLRVAYGLRLRKTAKHVGIKAPSVFHIAKSLGTGDACKQDVINALKL